MAWVNYVFTAFCRWWRRESFSERLDERLNRLGGEADRVKEELREVGDEIQQEEWWK